MDPKTRASPPPDFIPFQDVRAAASPPAGDRWLHEIQFDGYRVQVRIVDGKARFHARNGHDWTHLLPGLAAAARSVQDCVLDGELCALDPRGRSSHAALSVALPANADALVIFVFDVLWAPATGDVRDLPLKARKAVLRELLASADEDARDRYRFVGELANVEPKALFRAACDLGLEGIVSKRRDQPYRSGRSDGWVSSKCRRSVDVVVGGWRTRDDRFHSLILGRWEAGQLRHVGSVQAGDDDATIADLVARLQSLEVEQHRFDIGAPPKPTGDTRWVRPDLVAAIEQPRFTADGNLHQGRFKGLRLDKTAEDLKMEAPPEARRGATPEQ
ncbi:MAG TPA: non-homologous end-joining DNA ligase [Caulobacteraceae bacterium]|jgi:bifunctional non-homologous end joining protein LigD|nr:non-homologous end-joining DNA ligase [Caulobacteraceae bacterium]